MPHWHHQQQAQQKTQQKTLALTGRIILVKFPTRARPAKFFSTLAKYRELESGKHRVLYVVTCDIDDPTMNNPAVQAKFTAMDRLQVRYGRSTTKIEAVNADMDLGGPDWQILFLASDDMIPTKSWDDIVACEMEGHDAVWFYDGRATGCCTLSVMSRKKYLEQGYIYHPEYASLFCDNEWTETAHPKFVPQVVVRHEWPGPKERDDLMYRNNALWNRDKAVYERRKKAGFPCSSQS